MKKQMGIMMAGVVLSLTFSAASFADENVAYKEVSSEWSKPAETQVKKESWAEAFVRVAKARVQAIKDAEVAARKSSNGEVAKVSQEEPTWDQKGISGSGQKFY